VSGWINDWWILLVFAAGIGVGRAMERRRAKKNAELLAKSLQPWNDAADQVAKTMAEGGPWKKPK
jgi:hypothetical protein